jgi:hypoxanthine phosphoribosyltransferase
MVDDTISLVHKKNNQQNKIIKWEDIMHALQTIVNKYSFKIVSNKYIAIYGVPRGGKVVAVVLSHMLNLPILERFEPKIATRILVVDDIVDSGATLNAMKRLYPNTHFLSIYVKESATTPEYYYEKIRDEQWMVFPWEKNNEKEKD